MTTASFSVTGTSTVALPAHLLGGQVEVWAYGGNSVDSTANGNSNGGAIVTGFLAAGLFPLTCVCATLNTAWHTGSGNGAPGGNGYSGGGGGHNGPGTWGLGFGGAGSTAILTGGTTKLIEAGGSNGGGQGRGGSNVDGCGSGGGALSGQGTNGGGFGPYGGGAGGASGGNGGTDGSGTQAGGTGFGGGSAVNGGNASGIGGGGGATGTYTFIVVGCGANFASGSVSSPNYGRRAGTDAGFLYSSGLGAGRVTFAYTVADPPFSPTPTAPVYGSYLDSNALGVTFGYTPNPNTDSGSQNAYCLSIQQDSGAIQYWNATTVALVGSPVWNACSAGNNTVAVPAGILADGHQYTWAIATQEAHFNLQSTFCSSQIFSGEVSPSATIIAPTASQSLGTVTPTITWTDVLPGGGTQATYRIVIYTATQAGIGGFVPGVSPSTYDTGLVSSAGTTFTIPSGHLLDSDSYVAYLQITESPGSSVSAWVNVAFSVVFDGPMAPTLSAVASIDPITQMPITDLAWIQNDNLLPAADSTYESGLGGTQSQVNCTTVQFANGLDGSHCCQMIPTAGGFPKTMTYNTVKVLGIVAGQPYTAIGFMAPNTAVSRQVSLNIAWFNAGGSLISTSLGAAVPELATAAAWVPVVCSAVAPAGAVGAELQPQVTADASTSDLHDVDCLALYQGSVLGSPQNLVPDSDLLMVESGIPTWSNDPLFPAINSQFVNTGTGVSAGNRVNNSLTIDVVPGTSYLFSAAIDASQVTAGAPNLIIEQASGAVTTYATITQTAGVSSTVGTFWTAPAGVTQVRVQAATNNCTVAAGEEMTIGQIQLVNGFVAYTRGPTWSMGGYVSGTENVEVQRSLDQITWTDVRNGSAVPEGGALVDFEAPFNTPAYYRARTTGLLSGVPTASLWSPVVSLALSSLQWWMFNPLAPETALGLHRAAFVSASLATGGQASLSVDAEESQGQFTAFGNPDYLVLHGDVHNEEFDVACIFLGEQEWTQFNELREQQTTLLLRSDLGDLYYVDLGPARPGIILRGDRLSADGPFRQCTFHCFPSGMP